jgi:hypothetical protein
MGVILGPQGRPLPIRLGKLTEEEKQRLEKLMERETELKKEINEAFAKVEEKYEPAISALFEEMLSMWESLAKARGYNYEPEKDVWAIDPETDELIYVPTGREFQMRVMEEQMQQPARNSKSNLRLLKH